MTGFILAAISFLNSDNSIHSIHFLSQDISCNKKSSLQLSLNKRQQNNVKRDAGRLRCREASMAEWGAAGPSRGTGVGSWD